MAKTPQGLGLLGYVSEVKTAVRVKDLASHPRSVGLPPNHPPMKTFLGMPVFHHREHVGNLYLTEKEGGLEFTEEDQHIAAMLAAQAATVICNVRRYEEEHRAKVALEALLHISPVGVVLFDAQKGRIAYMNQEIRRMLQSLEIEEYGWDDLFPACSFRRPDGRMIDFTEMPIPRVLQTGEAVRADEMVVKTQRGIELTILSSAAPIFSDSGQIVSVVNVIQDMSPLQEMERNRAEFLARVSEEMRTPLTTIKGSAIALSSIAQATGEREPLQLLRIIDQQADLMRSQVNSLIELTQIEAGTLDVATELVEVAGLVEKSCGEYLREYFAVDIQLEIPDGLPSVAVDRHRINQVLHNFLRQAAKHSGPLSPVRVSASSIDTCVAISVSSGNVAAAGETTLPLESTEAPLFFRRFSQPHGGADGLSSQGEGLALAYCRGVVEAHGGRMRTEVDEHESRMTLAFTLPAVEDDDKEQTVSGSQLAPQAPEVRAETQASPSERVQVLVSIEDLKLQNTVRKVLITAGYDPATTSDLAEVEPLASAGIAKLIVMDIAGREDECFRTLRRARESFNLPAIVLCDRDDEDYVVRAFEMGADGYMVKPLSPSEMVARVKAILRRSSTPAETGSGSLFQLRDLLINFYERTVTVSGQPVQLTATEYKLLSELSNSAGRVLTQDLLLQRIWGPEYVGDTQLLRSYVKSLRQKLGDDARNPLYIFTEHGVGYRMAKPPSEADEGAPAGTALPGSARAPRPRR